jgi:hypothetical protein
LVDAGAEQLAPPTLTPWNHRDVRLAGPAGMQLTLFTVVPDDATGSGDADINVDEREARS